MSRRSSNPDLTNHAFFSAEKGECFGRVEVVTRKFASGWFLSSEPGDFAIVAYLDGVLVGQSLLDRNRSDITTLSGVERPTGFLINWQSGLDVKNYQAFHSGLEIIARNCVTSSETRIESSYANSVFYPASEQSGETTRLPLPDIPKVSIIMPVYDRTQALRESIVSVLNQTYRNIELVVVGDDPPDQTKLILEEFSADTRVKMFMYGDRSGNACRGRNTGILLSTGDIVAFQDSDDIAFPSRISDSVYCFTSTCDGKVDLVYTGIKALLDGSRSIAGINFGDEILPGVITIEEMEQLNPMFTCTVAVRKDCILKHGPFRREMTYREDHELWLRIASRGATFYAMPYPEAFYRIHAGNAELTFLSNDEQWKSQMLSFYRQPFRGAWTW